MPKIVWVENLRHQNDVKQIDVAKVFYGCSPKNGLPLSDLFLNQLLRAYGAHLHSLYASAHLGERDPGGDLP